jgi:hypothetical protein
MSLTSWPFTPPRKQASKQASKQAIDLSLANRNFFAEKKKPENRLP